MLNSSRTVLLGVAVVLAAGLFFTLTPNDTRSGKVLDGEVSVVLTNEGFEPREFTIVRGTVVTFSTTRDKPFWPASNIHPNHEIYPEFDPERSLSPTQEWSFTFERTGTFGLHDHLRAYFNGVIHVVEE